MSFSQAREFGGAAVERLKRMPLPIAGGVAVALLATVIFGMVAFYGTAYVTLFDGLTPEQGGGVIGELQKLGIPYKLAADGNVIRVPASDLGRARLELAKAGEPSSDGTAALRDLVKTPMTASVAAVHAMQMQSTESQIESSVQQVTGARYVRVLLAIPRYTPFLADQPEPKASVVMAGAPEADAAIGLAVARLVAGAVPGLSVKDVVVETEAGRILYPMTNAGTVAQQFSIQRHVEASDEAKIREILTPIFGAANYRVAVSSDIGFSRKTIDRTLYGPESYPTSDDLTTTKKVGSGYAAMGIPGALSNQPPGPTTAPVVQPATKAGGIAKPAAAPAKQRPATVMPRSSSHHKVEAFAIDQTHTFDRLPAWQIKSTSVSVVVAPPALGRLTTAAVKSMVAAAIAVPVTSVAVTTAAFVPPGHALEANAANSLPLLIRGGLLVLAALTALFGVVLPARRWLAERLRRPATGPHGLAEDADLRAARNALGASVSKEQALVHEQFQEIVGRIKNVADINPVSIARTLQNWSLEQPVPPRKES